MVIFEYFLKTRSDQNIHQNAPNCTILKNFLGGACPRTPLTKRMAKKKIIGPPPAKSWGRPCPYSKQRN